MGGEKGGIIEFVGWAIFKIMTTCEGEMEKSCYYLFFGSVDCFSIRDKIRREETAVRKNGHKPKPAGDRLVLV